MMVQNGRQALEALEKQRFDLVVMDISMPEMDGIAAVAAIRAKETATGFHLPTIAMTAHAMKGDRERCLAAGMDGYISKPVQPRELLRALESLLPAAAMSGGVFRARNRSCSSGNAPVEESSGRARVEGVATDPAVNQDAFSGLSPYP